ncbi:Phosphoprotein [Wickerhamomyces ciferrii]|uniref:Phosphoprotein n=1 Tax=Wickerhamomyces ciferrii (strain ATCC 14091 / BCRC 22168 / CBS 111 / JCM 3599 / NBRC 0793 / NRRL Y-1031 F-60-10) TaxID=1206466 RepID=K0KWE8_WICCF|nr:Phosphoprotein [Wickerhamomyces ciferrii]CCH45478.1 Phosphoprotein [Wickerhamomyces ciferrii]
MSHEHNSGGETEDVLLYILSFFIPPIPVLMREGCGFHLLLNIILTLLAGFPGIIHAVYIVYKTSYRKRSKRNAEYKHGGDYEAQHHQPQQQYHSQPQQQFNQAPASQSQGKYQQQQQHQQQQHHHYQAPSSQPQQQQQQHITPQQGQSSNIPVSNNAQQAPPNYNAAVQDSYPSDNKAQYKP